MSEIAMFHQLAMVRIFRGYVLLTCSYCYPESPEESCSECYEKRPDQSTHVGHSRHICQSECNQEKSNKGTNDDPNLHVAYSIPEGPMNSIMRGTVHGR